MVRYGNKNFNNREKAILTIRGKFDADNYANRKQAKLTTVQNMVPKTIPKLKNL